MKPSPMPVAIEELKGIISTMISAGMESVGVSQLSAPRLAALRKATNTSAGAVA